MKRKIHQLLSITKKRNLALALLFFSFSAFSQISYTFNFTGGIQTVTLTSGNWGIQCWGANGGSITSLGGGGIGGYSAGQINITTPGTPVNIYVGGRGFPATGTSASAGAGGWNGGGGGASVGRSGGGGGGASDVRLGGTAAGNRIIVAGGGGGAAYYGSSLISSSVAPGGNGGAVLAQNGSIIVSSGLITPGGGGAGANGATGGVATVASANGLASGGGGGGSSAGSSVGQPGVGGSYGGAAGPSAGGSTGSAGGGGGGYAGGAGGVQTSNAGVAGGGGSGFIGGVTTGTTVQFGQPGFFNNPNTSGNGLVILRELCNINMTASGVNTNNAICAPNSLTLTTSAVGNYNWSTGNTTSSVIVVSPSVTTVYTVAGTSSLNCSASTTYTVFVNNGVPALSIVNTASATAGICPGNTVALTANGATTYSWTNSVVNGAAFAPVNTTTYVVMAGNACGTASAAAIVSILPTPSLTAVVSQPSICSGNPVNITGVGNAVSYSITGGFPHATNFFPTSTAVYTVVGLSTFGCSNTAVAGVTVVATPLAPPLASPPLICIGSSAQLTSSGATNYTWTSPAGILSAQTITVSPLATTVYTLTKANANCVNLQTLTLTVNQLPQVFAIATPTIVCANRSTSLTGGGALTYTWTNGTNTTTGASPVFTPSANTIYTVAASDGTCVNTATVAVATNPNPTVSIAATSTNICFGQSVSLVASGAQGYTWTTAGITSNTNSATIAETPTASTLYTFIGDNAFSCTTAISQVVVVRTTPTLNISTTKTLVCTGAPSQLTVNAVQGSAPPMTYTWDANANGLSVPVVTVNPLVNTIYTVFATNNVTCSASQTILVSVFLPTFAVNSPTSSCLGGSVTLIASGANTYTWNGNQPFSQITVAPTGPTVYPVSATSSSNNVSCVSSSSVSVTIYQNPTVTAVASRTQICRGETTDITNGGAATYTLNTGLSGSVIPVTLNNNTNYTVTGTDQNGCIGTTTLQVRTSVCFGLNEMDQTKGQVLIYPNPSNGQVYLKAAADYFISVVNELGQVIRTTELNVANAYTAELQGLSAGIYFIVGESKEGKFTKPLIITE